MDCFFQYQDSRKVFLGQRSHHMTNHRLHHLQYDGDIFDVEQEHSLTQMVQIINQENVAPEDVLSDHVFILNL